MEQTQYDTAIHKNMKQEFINKWKSWWMLQKQGAELTEAFERELDAIIEQEVANKISSKPMLADSLPADAKMWKEEYDATCNLREERMWDNRYRRLEKGEMIQAGDEVDNCNDDWRDEPKWEPARCIGELAPDPLYPAHRVYRRLVERG